MLKNTTRGNVVQSNSFQNWV